MMFPTAHMSQPPPHLLHNNPLPPQHLHNPPSSLPPSSSHLAHITAPSSSASSPSSNSNNTPPLSSPGGSGDDSGMKGRFQRGPLKLSVVIPETTNNKFLAPPMARVCPPLFLFPLVSFTLNLGLPS